MKTPDKLLLSLAAWPLVLLASAAGAEGTAAQQVVLWKLKPLGLDEATAGRLEQMLRAEMRGLPGFMLVEQGRVDRLLEQPAAAALSGCTGQVDCLCDIGRALAADKVVTGVISALGENYILDLKMVDVAGRREEGRISEELGGQEDVLIGAIRAALYRLMVPRLYSGSLRVETAAEGAEVLLDDRAAGITPLPGTIPGLAPGSHRLAIRKEGFKPFEAEIQVRFQQVTVARVDLSHSTLVGVSYQDERAAEQPAPALSAAEVPQRRGYRVAAWTTAGLAAAAAVAGGLASWRASALEDEVAAAARQGRLDASYQSVIDRGERWAFWANVGWGTAAGAAALSAIFFVLGWSGPEAETAQPAATAGPGSLSLGWSF